MTAPAEKNNFGGAPPVGLQWVWTVPRPKSSEAEIHPDVIYFSAKGIVYPAVTLGRGAEG